MVQLKYVGNGEYLSGIPMRDLTDNEVKALGDDEVARLKLSRLYETWVEKPTSVEETPLARRTASKAEKVEE